MAKILSSLLLVIALLYVRASRADSTPTDFEGWLVLQTYISLDEEKRYQLYLENQPRIGNDWHRVATVQSRAGLNYIWNKRWSTMVGYAWAPLLYNAQYHRLYIDESRLWQQVAYSHQWLGIQWTHRLRQEQRFIVGVSGVSNRSRYQIKGSYALADDGSFGLTGFDELMVNLNDVQPAPWSGYDRNRVFFGPFWVVDGHRFEVGYLGEHQKRFGSDERWVNTVVAVATFNF